MALDTGCFFDYDAPYAGAANSLYWRGCCVLDNVHDGVYDLTAVSLASLKKKYA
jgi:hypothetical protein